MSDSAPFVLRFASTRIPNARPIPATARPMAPNPTTPSVSPASSTCGVSQ